MATATKFDIEALRSGQEGHDADVMTDLYADDAESTTVDTSNPPSRPRVLRGKEEIAAYWKDVMDRGMKHKIEKVVVGDDSVAYQVACQYDDGTRVACLGGLRHCGRRQDRARDGRPGVG